MRIRNFHTEDMPVLVSIQQAAAEADERPALSEDAFIAWLIDAEVDANANAFVITDDDDELNTWGQAGTLEGIEGEIIGYTGRIKRAIISIARGMCIRSIAGGVVEGLCSSVRSIE
jgi:hypothetical protein